MTLHLRSPNDPVASAGGSRAGGFPHARPRPEGDGNELPDLMALADSDRLQQVLGNLVGNAIKYGRVEDHVTVRAAKVEGAMELCVLDDGPGIPAESLERVFERFYRVDSREQGGTGLGLSIVKHIVLCHGGKVWAKSEPGNGSAFYFTLPDN